MNTWTFDDIDFKSDFEDMCEKEIESRAKNNVLHEMLMDRMKNGDFESETYKILFSKKKEVEEKHEINWSLYLYLSNLSDGLRFDVPRRVGRAMQRLGLSLEQAKLFVETHKNHMKAMDDYNRKKYAFPMVKNVVLDAEENCLKVYYEDIWWHYTTKMEWY